MIEQEKLESKKEKKTYTGRDLIEATKEILRSDDIGKKLPDSMLEKLSKLLAKTAIKGDL
ncbi:MAG: hypothetical protein ABH860_00375 [bacterium]